MFNVKNFSPTIRAVQANLIRPTIAELHPHKAEVHPLLIDLQTELRRIRNTMETSMSLAKIKKTVDAVKELLLISWYSKVGDERL